MNVLAATSTDTNGRRRLLVQPLDLYALSDAASALAEAFDPSRLADTVWWCCPLDEVWRKS